MKKPLFSVFSTIILCINLSAQNSILSSGNWYKISTSTEGVYRITYANLLANGINPSGIDPRNIKMYGNGGGMLPEENNAPKDIDLQEIAIQIVGESDGVFDPSDYILFYGQAPDKWIYDETNQTFSHQKNLYTDHAFYFITVGNTNGKRILSQNSSTTTVTNISDHYDNLIFHELENVNLIQSGREWFGELFDTQLNYAFNFNIPNIDLSENVTLNSSVAARSSINSQIDITSNANSTSISLPSVNLTSSQSRHANIGNAAMSFTPSSTTIPISFSYNQPTPNSIAWLNYFELFTRNNLSKNTNQLIFRDIENIGIGNTTNFKISNTSSSDIVWEITDHNNVVEQNKTFSSGATEFNLSTDNLREFIVFDLGNALVPTLVGQVPNQNLHGITPPEMIIVTHPGFVNEANTLANHHIINDGINTEIVTTEEIYNEFSSGKQDITAINNFAEYIYNQPNSPLKYLLLFGDGSYDYKNRVVPNTNFVPTYQSENSIDIIGSLTSDDFFGLLDSNEGAWASTSETLDIGIGRLPVKNVQEANDIVSKIINYSVNPNYDNWQKTITFIGDDEDSNIHMGQADQLAKIVEDSCQFIVEKLYLDEFQQVTNGSQQSYPEAEQKILNSFRRGSLIINFNGHAGINGLTSEKVLSTSSIDTLNNDNHPLIIMPTSEISRYDNPSFTSLGEKILLNPNAGSIATFSTTRLTFSTPNFLLNETVYQTIFKKTNNQYPTLGDVFKEVKNLNALSLNNRSFSLLGDPALTLNFPELIVNAIHPDTLQSNTTNTITGQIEDDNSFLQSSFSGNLTVFIQGSNNSFTTLANDGGSPFSFLDRRDTVYYDTIPVINGIFSYNINLSNAFTHIIGNAKINYYAFDGVLMDASGCDDIQINDLLTSIDDVTADEIETKIYPNPSSNNVTVSIKNDDNVSHNFILYNNMGQVVMENNSFEKNQLSFSVEDYSNGIYYYNITSSKNQLTSGKLIVQH